MMARHDERHTKVTPEHLERAAYVYVRQSTFYQVEHHRESTRRQDDLVAWAVDAGWANAHQRRRDTSARARTGNLRCAGGRISGPRVV